MGGLSHGRTGAGTRKSRIKDLSDGYNTSNTTLKVKISQMQLGQDRSPPFREFDGIDGIGRRSEGASTSHLSDFHAFLLNRRASMCIQRTKIQHSNFAKRVEGVCP